MKREDEQALLLLGLYLLAKYSWEITPALQRSGARLYDWLHDDMAHKRDLPGRQLTKQTLLQLATRAGFPDPKLAVAICLAESGGVTGAITRSTRENSIGLWQINVNVHPYSEDDMKDPTKNAAAAFEISKRGTDWRPWTAYKSGKYKQFLTGVLA